MAFNSLTFLIFITLFGAAWAVVKNNRLARYALIVIASFIFYGWWDWRFLFLLIFTGIVDFSAGLAMDRAATPLTRKLILAASLISNLGVLFIFKYSGFVGGVIDGAIGTDLKNHIPAFTLILPVGISFYTFQSLSYTIDVYKRHLKPTHNPLHFFAFIALFPQLVAGPIIRATDLLWKLEGTPRTTEPQRFTAIKLIVLGYIQKLLIADNLAGYVDRAFANPQESSGTLFWWGVMAAFAVQIYCDFAGYSNIARGLLKFMALSIKPNFRFPYLATGFRDFWNRWHISLSHWFRDYVYIPLGGSRMSKTKQTFALWATFLLSGLWHGASFTFIAWGALHAAYVQFERLTRWPKYLPHTASVLITFMMATIAWVFFRSANFADSAHIASNMLMPIGGTHVDIDWPFATLLTFIALEAYVLKQPIRKPWAQCAVLACALSIAIIFRGPGHGFIYFQF